VEADALTVDLDSDDAYPLYGRNPLTGFAVLRVRVASSTSATRSLWYLNVVVDLNRDGRWRRSGTATEWVGRNVLVQLNPGENRLVLIPFQAPSEAVWMRIAVTDSQIDPNIFAADGWDGSGPENGFTRGEIEDWLLAPYWRGDPPTPTPTPPPTPAPPNFKDFDIEFSGATWNPNTRMCELHQYCEEYWFTITIKNRGSVDVTMHSGKLTVNPGRWPDRWGTDMDGDPATFDPLPDPPPAQPVVIAPGGSFSFWLWLHEVDLTDAEKDALLVNPTTGLRNVGGFFQITPNSPGDLTVWGEELAWQVPLPVVGGVAGLPETADTEGNSYALLATIATGAVAAIVALGASVWYARRRLRVR
jgi:hypothetical protein